MPNEISIQAHSQACEAAYHAYHRGCMTLPIEDFEIAFLEAQFGEDFTIKTVA